MASADCWRAMRAQETSGGTSAKRVEYSARRLSFSAVGMGGLGGGFSGVLHGVLALRV